MSSFPHKADEAAAAWDARLRGGMASFEERRAFHQWLEDDDRHQESHDRLQSALTLLRANAELPELSALRDEARNSVHENRRRRLLSVLSVAVAAMVLLVLVVATRTDSPTGIAAIFQGETVYATSPNERASVTLADGSVVTLDSASRVAVRLGKARREITLMAGHALFEVAKDRQRPFVVRAGERTITALGTVFDVTLSPRELRVTLAEGSVAVRPVRSNRGAEQQILQPRQQLVAAEGVAVPEIHSIDTDKALSWAEGKIFFEDEPLASAAEQMNRYARRKIIVDPSVAGMRISGMFRTANQSGFVEAIQVTLPVEAENDGEGRILVSRRSGHGSE